jgi:hypothetical protein
VQDRGARPSAHAEVDRARMLVRETSASRCNAVRPRTHIEVRSASRTAAEAATQAGAATLSRFTRR